MAQVIRGLDAARVRANLDARPRRAGRGAAREPGDVQVLAAVEVRRARGARGAGRGRRCACSARTAPRTSRPRPRCSAPSAVTWDFIGHLQTRKVRQVLPLVRWIHSVASDSVLAQLGPARARRETEVLVEVNVAGEPGKSGVAPAELDAFLARVPGAASSA